MKVPDWVDIVKLGRHKELAPKHEDWYYIRAGEINLLFIEIKDCRKSRFFIF